MLWLGSLFDLLLKGVQQTRENAEGRSLRVLFIRSQRRGCHLTSTEAEAGPVESLRRCLGPRADSGRKKTRHNNLVRSLTERAH